MTTFKERLSAAAGRRAQQAQPEPSQLKVKPAEIADLGLVDALRHADRSFRNAIVGQWLDTEPAPFYEVTLDRRGNIVETRDVTPAVKAPDPYAEHRLEYERAETLRFVDARPASVAARLRNIAALSTSLSESSAKRRGRLRYDGTVWQEWPAGDERNEP
jgi:hypothetical protein